MHNPPRTLAIRGNAVARRSVQAFVLAAPLSLVVAAPLSTETFQAYGGVYSARCREAAADKAIITRDSLIFRRGSREVVASNVEQIASSYGSSPPKDFQLTLMGTIAPATGLAFDIFKARGAQYLRINGHPVAMKAINQRDDEVQFNFCGRSAP